MYFLLFLILIYKCYSYHLFKNKFLDLKHWETIKTIIINTNKNSETRIKINKIIYAYYDDWSYCKAIEFKNFHYHKCKNIPLLELYLYSNTGLLKAITNYNGKSNFTNYAKVYIKGELYKGLTELYPICRISKKERSRKKTNLDINNYKRSDLLDINIIKYDNLIYKIGIKNNYYNHVNYWDKSNENYEEFWEKINTLQPFEKNLIYSKFDYILNKKVSNKYLSTKFGYSEEYIRLKIKSALKSLHIL
jgi:hypothetical protein